MIEAPTRSLATFTAQAASAVEAVTRTFRTRRGEVEALAGMSLRARRDEVVAVVGPSGCGKTTLLELICGLQRPDAGRVRAAPAALMPQRDLLLPWLSALDNAALALRARGSARERGAARRRRRGSSASASAGSSARGPPQLSGGMRQRVSFLRTLLAGKPVLALDEPFAALDAITRQEMQGWLGARARGEPRTVVLVTHDVEEAVRAGRPGGRDVAPPGHAVAEIEVALPRPRRRTDPGRRRARERALEALGVRT